MLGRAVSLLLLAPLAGLGASAAGEPYCSDATDAPDNPEGIYVIADPPRAEQVWAESNLYPGLQRVVCLLPDDTLTGADTELFEVT